MIIYPPFIRDTIPAFTTDKIVIPFSQNPAVSIKEVTSFGLIVKDYLSSNIIANLTAAADTMHLSYNSDTKSGEVIFDIVKWKEDEIARINADEKITDKQAAIDKVNKFPETKQYYKFQMSYSDDDAYNAYSSASIGRCIGNLGEDFGITVFGLNTILDSDIVNIDTTTYAGEYTTSILSEPIYSYRFIFRNKNTKEIIQDTGDVLHNVDADTIDGTKRISNHIFKLRYELALGEYYELIYSITTINGYTIETKPYTIIKAGQLPIIFQGNIIVSQDETAKDNGYVKISIVSDTPCKGNFIIERTSNNIEWNAIAKFSLTNISDLSLFTWKDWSVEQGENYTYALRQYASNQYSERMLSKPISVEFEHMYLSDGKRQLKIEYNPTVSSFKNTILEQKIDTIGGKYPFFFRNNQVRYKEIPISGLISYQMDKDNFFMDDDDLGLVNLSSVREVTAAATNVFDNLNVKTTQLTNYNYAAERKFKLAVLEWLTNGEPKLFRSPAEGNYVVRLMNTSLSPNDTLGRMLHTFSATGYEIFDNDTITLIEKGLINLPELKDPEPNKVFKTLDLEWLGKEESKTFSAKEIENIIWNTNLPNFEDKIILIKDKEEQSFCNTVGIFTTPAGITFDSIKVTKDILINGSITFQYYPDLTEDEGIDVFAEMINASDDVLFSAPMGTTLYNKDNGILVDRDDETGELITTTIYKTYTLVVRKDINATYTDPKEYILTLGEEQIDCSDGQIRYYYNLDPSIAYEKGLGLHLDIYARIQIEGASSNLGHFILGKSRLKQGEVK